MGLAWPLEIRRVLGRKEWGPPRPFGPDGWAFRRFGGPGSIIVTRGDFDGAEWIHASIARDRMPTYDDLALLHRAAFGDGYAFQVFAPADHHVNIHEHALHLWGRADGASPLPDFAWAGTI